MDKSPNIPSDAIFEYLNKWIDKTDKATLQWIDIRNTNWYPTKHFVDYAKDRNFHYGSSVKDLYKKIQSGEITYPIIVEKSTCKKLDENMKLTEEDIPCFSVRDGVHRVAIHEDLGKFMIPALVYEKRKKSITRNFAGSFKTKADFEKWAGSIDALYVPAPKAANNIYPFFAYSCIRQFDSMIEGEPIFTDPEFAFLSKVYNSISTGTKYNRPQLEKIAEGFGMKKYRSIKELTELAYLMLYRSIAMNQSLSVDEKYKQIIDIYNRQTTLYFGDQDTLILQQYSTPAPISYLLGQWCLDELTKVKYPTVVSAKKVKSGGGGYKMFKGLGGASEQYVVEFSNGHTYKASARIDNREDAIEAAKKEYFPQLDQRFLPSRLSAFEPSAGNGLLTVALDPAMVTVNEIDPLRGKSLKIQGFNAIYHEDASKPMAYFPRLFDIILSNPPFGGHSPVDFGGFSLAALEHIMVANALDKMVVNGRGAFVIGGHTKYDTRGRLTGRDKPFFQFLSKTYELLDVINLDGSLYSRQGTTYPIRLILINGKKNSDRNFPLFNADISHLERLSPQKITNFMDLKKRIYGEQ